MLKNAKFQYSAMKKLPIVIVTSILFSTSQVGMVFASDAITYEELATNMDLILPQATSISGLAEHSNWQEVEMTETYYGIEAVYHALYDENYTLSSELPTIYAYVIPYSSEESLESEFETWINSDKFTTGAWSLLDQGVYNFSYKTGAGTESDIMMDYSSESNTLHYITRKDNLLIAVNFYRTGGEYNRGNVLAYEDYVLNYDDTLDVLKGVGSYIKESVDFYLDNITSGTGPDDYDYYASSAEYSMDLDEIYSVPLNGSIEFSVYLDDGSEVGTILDSTGVDTPQYGSMTLGINENAILDFNIYDPYTKSACSDSSGWQRIYSEEPIDIYEWSNIKIEYGAKTGMNIYLNGRLQEHCEAYRSRSGQPLYLGDYVGDIIEESFVGYIKGFKTVYSKNEDGSTTDSVQAEMIFTDVGSDYKYAEAIEYLRDAGMISGYDDGSFKPDQEINRAEILKMLLLGFGYEVPELEGTEETFFADVEAGSWYEKYIVYAAESGFVDGYADATYKPDQNVNRVEFLKILTRIYGIDLSDYAVTGIYTDTDALVWYAPYVQYSKDNNLIDVGLDNMFYPANAITRGEVAEAIYRIMNIE
ncbi:MAG: amidase [uncultured bacterium]|nr:MAG: amidase [uncultured bacterium]